MFKRTLRRGITILATTATVLWSISAIALVPVVAQAAAGDIVKSADAGTLYVVLADGESICKLTTEGHYDMWAKYKDMGVARWKDVQTVDISTYTNKGVCSLRAGSLVRTKTNPEVFVIQAAGTKRGFDSWQTFTGLGYGSGGVYYIADEAINAYTTATKITSTTAGTEIREGQLIKYAGNATVYYVAKDGTTLVTRQLTAETAYWSNFGINWNLVITIPATETYTASASTLSGADTSINRPVAKTIVVTPPPAGTISFALASDTPSGVLAPTKSYGTVFTKYTVSGSGTLTSIKVKREGLGPRTDFAGVYLYVDGVKFTTARTFNSDDEALFSLGSGLQVTSGTPRTISIVGDMAAITATGQHRLGIAAASAITSDATIAGSFPLLGNYVSTSTTAVGELTVNDGTVSDTEIYVGEQAQEVSRYTFVSGSAEKVKVNSVRFRHTGSAKLSTDYVNFALYKGSTKLDGVTFTVSGDYVTASNVNLTFDKSQTNTIKLFADVVSGAASTIQFEIEEAADVSATGLSYGYGVTINNTAGATTWSEQKSNATAITILSGTLTFAIPGPAAKSVGKKTDDIVLANLTITAPANETITISKMYAFVAGTEAVAGDNIETTVENVQLVQKTGGTQVIDATTSDGTANDNKSFYFANFDVKGATTWDVIMDTNDSYATAADAFKFTLFADDDSQTVGDNAGVVAIAAKNSAGKTLTSSDRDDIKPGTTISSNNTTLSDEGLTVAKVSLDNGSAVAKELNIPLLKLMLVAGAAGDVKVTQLALEETVGGTTNTADGSADVSNFSLYEVAGATETLLQSGKSASTATDDFTVTFDSLKNGTGLVIPANGTKYILVKADFTSGVTNGEVLAIQEQADGIDAEKVSDGSALADGDINDDAVITGRQVTARSSGKLTIVKNTDITNAATTQVLAGTTGITTMNLNFKAEYENVGLKLLKFDLVNSSAADSVAAIYLYDGTTPILTGTYTEADAEVSFGDGQSVFYTLTKDVIKTLTLVTDLRSIGGSSGTADSGDEVKWRLDAPIAEASDGSITDPIIAGGVSSNSNLTFDLTAADSYIILGNATTHPADQDSNIFHVRRSLISDLTALKLGTSTPVDGTTTTLTDGTAVELFRFRITSPATANENAAVDLKGLKLTATVGGGITLANAKIYRSDAAGTKINASTTSATALEFTSAYSSALSGLANITPGTSATFVVTSDVSGAGAADTIQMSIADLGDQSDESTAADTTDFTYGALIWSDNDDTVTDNETSWVSWPGINISDVIGQTRIFPPS